MNQAPFEQAGSLRIGTVDFVSPDEIKVALDIEAPESVALNAGSPRPFPRVNGYLLIPVDEAFLVGQVEWLTVERSAFPKRRGMKDFGLVDLPYPLRKLRLNPLGTLRAQPPEGKYVFSRGASGFPSIGAAVVLPTAKQLRSIVESGLRRRIKIGTSPLAGDAEVFVDPNRLFGRHLAVLGNTGSGKSCSVAGLIRWSLEQAEAQKDGKPNARFIVLDPNGEYSRAFSGDNSINARVFKVNPARDERELKVPLWFWNSAEWCAFTQASARTQRPLLRRALREVRAGRSGMGRMTEEQQGLALRRKLSSRYFSLQQDRRSGAIHSDESKFGFRLRAFYDDLKVEVEKFPDLNLGAICHDMKEILAVACNEFEKDGKKIKFYRAFADEPVRKIAEDLRVVIDSLGGALYEDGPSEDAPIPFEGIELADHLDMLAEQENVTQWVDFLTSRIRALLSDTKMKPLIADVGDYTLKTWLDEYVGAGGDEHASVSIVDLSLVPMEITHIMTAVIARTVFEALQRYMRLNKVALPTVLVMEEAHTFVKRYKEDVENQDAAGVCCQVFERIAREGRKFGLGLVLSSQRPVELSQTVLSQCNTFLLHRISNDRDQELVHRLVPDNLRGLLRELPSLPSQRAILLGWASELPVLVKMKHLPKVQQPRSDDPKFWEVWTGRDEAGHPVERYPDWAEIVDDWQNGGVAPEDEADT